MLFLSLLSYSPDKSEVSDDDSKESSVEISPQLGGRELNFKSNLMPLIPLFPMTIRVWTWAKGCCNRICHRRWMEC